MSETPALAFATGFMRTTFCPQCDYSLIGLPAEGTCPECGRAYDQSFAILRGRPGNNPETGALSRPTAIWNFAGMALILIVVFHMHVFPLHNPIILLPLVFLLLLARQ